MTSSTAEIEHFSHPKHPLVFKEDVVIGVYATCCVCHKPVIGTPTYTCSRSDDSDCQNFYLHKNCAELPIQIIRDWQDEHPLTLRPRPSECTCDICSSPVRFAYACVGCNFDVCVVCVFISTFLSQQKVIYHEGHKHKLTLLQRQASFRCDACWERADDYSYVCIPCDYWIHDKCASSPPIIPEPTYHHHPLTLIFSIPVEHRYFYRYCAICKKRVQSLCWSYYCHKCTFFVHLKCSTSTISLVNEIEENGIIDDEPDLLQFPLPEEESLFDLIITQCSKLFQGKGENSSNDPQIIEEHWSHSDHSLELHQLIVTATDSDEDNNNNDDRRVLICDGCVQPISVSHPSYYACIQCDFYLHSFCANKLPPELPVGVSPFHPQHPLILNQIDTFYNFVKCGICGYWGNGFFYKCEICKITVDIRCAFLPMRIRHKSHKQHPLVRRPFSNSRCSVSNLLITHGVEYACETCDTFQIHILFAFYPSRLKHRYDDHSIMLKHPPFFHEGVIYCQICEEQLDNQYWLYSCDECDQPFHFGCIRLHESIKLGGTIRHIIGNQPHTLALVSKGTSRMNFPFYICGICGVGYTYVFLFECDGCGYLACIYCMKKKILNSLRSSQSTSTSSCAPSKKLLPMLQH